MCAYGGLSWLQNGCIELGTSRRDLCWLPRRSSDENEVDRRGAAREKSILEGHPCIGMVLRRFRCSNGSCPDVHSKDQLVLFTYLRLEDPLKILSYLSTADWLRI